MVDVVIIGGGIAGLRVAGLLEEQGIEVRLLEARERVGGRLHSVAQRASVIDLGATWLWIHEQNVLALIDELGLETHDQHIDGDAVYHDPAGSQRIDGNPIDVPAGRFTGGAQLLAERLAARLRTGTIETGRIATAIHVNRDGLAVETNDGQRRARHVVLALPPALASHTISFEPQLPAPFPDLIAQTPVWMGNVVKVVVTYEHAFWRDGGLAGAAISHVGPLREVHDMSGANGEPAALFGFAPMVTPGTPTPTEAAVVAQLVEMFGPSAGEPTSVHIADWRTEAHTSPPGVELLRNHALFGHPAWDTPIYDGRLHWASTETSPVSPGHIDGALARAETIATRINALVGPDALR